MDATAAIEPGFVIRAFQGGGVFMYFILAFSLCTAALIIERGAFLFFGNPAAPSDFRQRVLECVLRGDFRAAEMLSKTYQRSGLARIASIGLVLRGNGGGEEELQARMDERLTAEISRIDRRTGFLAMFGNVSTLLGLLGTIAGMIRSFAAVASASPADRAMLLSKGISEAMNCTAFGLIVAIPALVAYAFYQNKTDRLVNDLTEQTAELYHDLIFMAEPAPVEAALGGRASAGIPAVRHRAAASSESLSGI